MQVREAIRLQLPDDIRLHQQAHSLCTQISVGWVTNLLVVALMLETMIVHSMLFDVNNGFRSIRIDPGVGGLQILQFFFALYALMPVYVWLVNGVRSRALRWVAVAIASLALAYLGLHHLAHWAYGQRPDFTSHVLDIVLHGIGIWVIVSSVRWARLALPSTNSRTAS